MQIIKIEREKAAEALLSKLKPALEKYRLVTWLVSGGSNIEISVEVMKQIPVELTDKLIIGLTDERYGPVGHPDSNWQQLINAGFELGKAKPLPALVETKETLDATLDRYNLIMSKVLSETHTIGQFGIGNDGHIAGIKPDTPASVAGGKLVFGYESDDFTRITLTFDAIKQLGEVYAFAFGEDKKEAMEKLAYSSHQLLYQPSQILKSIDNSCVYSDLVGNRDGETG